MFSARYPFPEVVRLYFRYAPLRPGGKAPICTGRLWKGILPVVARRSFASGLYRAIGGFVYIVKPLCLVSVVSRFRAFTCSVSRLALCLFSVAAVSRLRFVASRLDLGILARLVVSRLRLGVRVRHTATTLRNYFLRRSGRAAKVRNRRRPPTALRRPSLTCWGRRAGRADSLVNPGLGAETANPTVAHKWGHCESRKSQIQFPPRRIRLSGSLTVVGGFGN